MKQNRSYSAEAGDIAAEPLTLVTYRKDGQEHFAFLIGDHLYDVRELNPNLPADAATYVANWQRWHPLAKLMDLSFKAGRLVRASQIPTAHRDDVAGLEPVFYEGIDI